MQPVGSILPSAVRHLLKHAEMSQGKLEFAWKAAVGPAIDRVTSVRLADASTLEITAVDPAWRRELKRSQGTLLARLQELLGSNAPTAVRIVGHAGGRG